MFGTMGFSELIIILVIVLIIFGAGKLPQIGEGLGKALKGFKKEVHEMPPAEPETAPADQASVQSAAAPQPSQGGGVAPNQPSSIETGTPKPTAPYTPGPEATPGTTAALLANLGPQGPSAQQPARPRVATAPPASGSSQVAAHSSNQSPPTMEDRMAAPAPRARPQYPPLPPGTQPKPVAKRPSAVVNKDAVARVQAAQQAAMKAKAGQAAGCVSPQDMQHVGEGLGDALRTFRQAVADVRNTVDPEMRTIQAEMDAAQKELEQSIEAAKDVPVMEEGSSGKPA
jgi:TatA/E family protein of Tat protein translocase